MIVAPQTAEQVAVAVRYARSRGMRIGVRSGGHSWAAAFLRDGGMLLDLSGMRDLSVDAAHRTAWVQPGLAGDTLNQRLARLGLFFPTGHCASVGLGGFLLQGGFGWNSRLLGPACASVRAVEMVTPGGELIVADAERNPELYWAARGSGPGFFGVVTGFQLTLYPRPATTMVTTHIYPIGELEQLVRWLIEAQPEIPRSVECMLFLRRGLSGVSGPGAMLMAPVLADNETQAREALSFTSSCPCLPRAVERRDAVLTSVDELVTHSQDLYPDGRRFWVDNMWTDASADDLVPALTEITRTLPPSPSHVMMLMWGPPQPTQDMAFSMQANVYLGLYGVAQDPSGDHACREWSTEHMRRLEPLSCGIQLADENLGLRPAPFVSQASMRRIDELRRRFDPDDVFHPYMGRPATPGGLVPERTTLKLTSRRADTPC
jgi:FAD/FMN-containing dehydrogenase